MPCALESLRLRRETSVQPNQRSESLGRNLARGPKDRNPSLSPKGLDLSPSPKGLPSSLSPLPGRNPKGLALSPSSKGIDLTCPPAQRVSTRPPRATSCELVHKTIHQP